MYRQSVASVRSTAGLTSLAALLAITAASSLADAAVRREGEWPGDRKVSLRAERISRGEALRKLADAAGWSVVLSGAALDQRVDVRVKDEPADAVLELLLTEGSWVAVRKGGRISIAPASSEAPPPPAPPATITANVPPAAVWPGVPVAPDAGERTPPTPPPLSAPPAPPPPAASAEADAASPVRTAGSRGTDRVVTGNSVRVEKGEVVHDVAVFGGSADIFGTVTGDVSVFGGSVHLREGSVVEGDATTLGGSMKIDDGARVDGDVATLGGSIDRASGAQVGGDVTENSKRFEKKLGGDDEPQARSGDRSESLLARVGREAASAITLGSLLFVLGSVFIALAGQRMERLQTEVAARPMRTFALGVVGTLAALVLFVALCVVVVGIPFAIIGALLFALGTGAGFCATLTTIGAALVRHRAQSPYLHLAVGTFLWLVVSSLPWIGDLVTAVIVLIGIGTLVATRAAGLVQPRRRNGNGNGNPGGEPYRIAGG